MVFVFLPKCHACIMDDGYITQKSFFTRRQLFRLENLINIRHENKTIKGSHGPGSQLYWSLFPKDIKKDVPATKWRIKTIRIEWWYTISKRSWNFYKTRNYINQIVRCNGQSNIITGLDVRYLNVYRTVPRGPAPCPASRMKNPMLEAVSSCWRSYSSSPTSSSSVRAPWRRQGGEHFIWDQLFSAAMCWRCLEPTWCTMASTKKGNCVAHTCLISWLALLTDTKASGRKCLQQASHPRRHWQGGQHLCGHSWRTSPTEPRSWSITWTDPSRRRHCFNEEVAQRAEKLLGTTPTACFGTTASISSPTAGSAPRLAPKPTRISQMHGARVWQCSTAASVTPESCPVIAAEVIRVSTQRSWNDKVLWEGEDNYSWSEKCPCFCGLGIGVYSLSGLCIIYYSSCNFYSILLMWYWLTSYSCASVCILCIEMLIFI